MATPALTPLKEAEAAERAGDMATGRPPPFTLGLVKDKLATDEAMAWHEGCGPACGKDATAMDVATSMVCRAWQAYSVPELDTGTEAHADVIFHPDDTPYVPCGGRRDGDTFTLTAKAAVWAWLAEGLADEMELHNTGGKASNHRHGQGA